MNVKNQNLYFIRNSNPHIRITRLNNTRWLLLFLLSHCSLIKSKFLVFISRSTIYIYIIRIHY